MAGWNCSCCRGAHYRIARTGTPEGAGRVASGDVRRMQDETCIGAYPDDACRSNLDAVQFLRDAGNMPAVCRIAG